MIRTSGEDALRPPPYLFQYYIAFANLETLSLLLFYLTLILTVAEVAPTELSIQ